MKVRIVQLRSSFVVFCLSLIILAFAQSSSAREITDMNHRRIVVPDRITRVYSQNVTIEYMMAAVDSTLLVGRAWQMSDSQRAYFPKSYQNLPVVGGVMGKGVNVSPEMILAVKPDIILVRTDDAAIGSAGYDQIYQLGIPVVSVDVSSVTRYAYSFDFLGKLVNREKRASDLSSYIRKSLTEVNGAVARIPISKRLVVYSASGPQGLNSICANSLNAELVAMSGGINPVKCVSKNFAGIESVSMEQVVAMDPQVILSNDHIFANSVLQDSRWSDIQAIKSKRIYMVPRGPLSWVGLPSSYMQVLGLQWMTQLLYPAYYKKDIEKETQDFLQLFFGIRQSKEEIDKLIDGAYQEAGNMRGHH